MNKKEMKLYAKRRERIIALHKLGLSHMEIAKKLGMRTRQRVWQIVNGK